MKVERIWTIHLNLSSIVIFNVIRLCEDNYATWIANIDEKELIFFVEKRYERVRR
jgi:hypothetical protein